MAIRKKSLATHGGAHGLSEILLAIENAVNKLQNMSILHFTTHCSLCSFWLSNGSRFNFSASV